MYVRKGITMCIAGIVIAWLLILNYQKMERQCYDDLEKEVRSLHRDIEKAEFASAFMPMDTVVSDHAIIKYLALITIYNDVSTTLGNGDTYIGIIDDNVRVGHLRDLTLTMNDELRTRRNIRIFLSYGKMPWHWVFLGIRTS
jgi:hypothetical protein